MRLQRRQTRCLPRAEALRLVRLDTAAVRFIGNRPDFSGATNATGFTFMITNEARFGQKSVPVGHKMTLERRLCLRGTDIRPAWTRFPHVDGKGAAGRSQRVASRRGLADEGRVGREVEKVPTLYRALDAPSLPALHQSGAASISAGRMSLLLWIVSALTEARSIELCRASCAPLADSGAIRFEPQPLV